MILLVVLIILCLFVFVIVFQSIKYKYNLKKAESYFTSEEGNICLSKREQCQIIYTGKIDVIKAKTKKINLVPYSILSNMINVSKKDFMSYFLEQNIIYDFSKDIVKTKDGYYIERERNQYHLYQQEKGQITSNKNFKDLLGLKKFLGIEIYDEFIELIRKREGWISCQ